MAAPLRAAKEAQAGSEAREYALALDADTRRAEGTFNLDLAALKLAFGDVLCIVEAMKVMNEIRADRPGLLKKILVENGKPVSAGQDLFLIEPAA